MTDKKNICLKVLVDSKTEAAFKKILEKKGLTIQAALEEYLSKFIFQNVDCLMVNNDRK